MKWFSVIRFSLVLPLLPSCSLQEGRDPHKANIRPPLREVVSYPRQPHGEPVKEGRWSVEGRFLFLPDHDSSVFPVQLTTLAGEEVCASCSWWTKETPAVDTRKLYHFELLNEAYTDPAESYDEILRVSEEGRVLFDASICHIHKCRMRRGITVARNGEAYPDPFFRLQRERFPNDGNHYVRCGSAAWIPAWKCSQCSRAYGAWVRKHGIDDKW
jgi:hypothetical protein